MALSFFYSYISPSTENPYELHDAQNNDNMIFVLIFCINIEI